jgi:hypothetical protein
VLGLTQGTLSYLHYVIANLRTPTEVTQYAIAQLTMNHDGSSVVPASIDIGGLSFTLSKTGLLKETRRKFESLYFGYVAQWEGFRGAAISKQLFPMMTRRCRGSSFSSPVLRLSTMVLCRC